MDKIRFNFKNQLAEIKLPAIMGIINYTPDSYFADSRVKTVEQAISKVESTIYSINCRRRNRKTFKYFTSYSKNFSQYYNLY